MHHHLANIALLISIAGLVGCSTYGWAGDPAGDEPDQPTLRVAPVAAPAHLGLDRVALRTVLIEELELRGLRVEADETSPALECTVNDPRTTGAIGGVVAELTLSCAIVPPGADDPERQFEFRGLAADRLDPTLTGPLAALRTDERVANGAAADAIPRIASRVVDAVSEEAEPGLFRPDRPEEDR